MIYFVTPGVTSRRSCRIMVLAASWALSDLGKQRLAFSGGRDVPVSKSLHPRNGFVWDSGIAGPRLCQLLEVLGLPAFQVKVVYHPTNLATLGDDLLRLLCLLFLYSVTKTRVSCQCVCGGGGDITCVRPTPQAPA